MRLLTLTEISRLLNLPYRLVKKKADKVDPIAFAHTGGFEHRLYKLEQFAGLKRVEL